VASASRAIAGNKPPGGDPVGTGDTQRLTHLLHKQRVGEAVAQELLVALGDWLHAQG
jgi:hypothetical protein